MKYKMICADIDGTLLDDDKKLLPEVRDSLREEADKGIKIVLASGRMPSGVELIEEELGISCIKMCNAGSYILLGDQCISEEYFSLETMQTVYRELAEKYDIPLWIFHGREWYVTGIDKYIEKEIQIIQTTPEVVSMEGLTEKWSRENVKPNKVLLAADPPILQKIYLEMKERQWEDVDMACSAVTFAEVFPKGVNKGTALSKICQKLEIRSEQTVAFGDQELDLPMIEAAGVGIAMGNAISELKKSADFVTKSNNEAGIAYALKNYF